MMLTIMLTEVNGVHDESAENIIQTRIKAIGFMSYFFSSCESWFHLIRQDMGIDFVLKTREDVTINSRICVFL